MKALRMVLGICVLTAGASFYHYIHANNTSQATAIITKTNGIESSGTPPCKCFCGGKNWDEGSTACMGGFKQVCAPLPSAPVPGGSRSGCGWATQREGKEPKRCNGDENCK